jgi:hypothetical protein
VREVELRLTSLSAPARMMKIFEAEGGAQAAPGSLPPTIKLVVTALGDHRRGMQPGCLMKIFEAERWLKGTNFHEVAFLQRRQDESDTSAPHPGARKVEGRDA